MISKLSNCSQPARACRPRPIRATGSNGTHSIPPSCNSIETGSGGSTSRCAPRRRGRILSIGCGGGADFQIAPHRFTGSTVVLVDLDRQALALAEERLSRYCDVHIVCGDVRRAIRQVQDEGPFDVVVCGCLSDYLDDRTIISILGELRRRLLRVGGSIVFTNIAAGNPFRVWMEAIADWKLVHRSEPELRKIATAAGFDRLDFSVRRDPTGLTHLVELSVP
ncbi:class I SAM-dependent methyltransferase [Bradyrhizobium diazoefficiens]